MEQILKTSPWRGLGLLRCSLTALFRETMNRLKQVLAILLNPTEDPEQTHAVLEAAGVPVSFADCRVCPNPCEDGKRAPSPIFDMLDNRVRRPRGISEENSIDD